MKRGFMNYTIKNDQMSISVSSHGGELQSIKDTSDYEYLWQGNPDYWARRAPILFPIVGKLKNNTYKYNETTYVMTQHGFARDMAFKLVEESETTLVFELCESQESLSKYPFKFTLRLGYTLTEQSVLVSYYVKNTDSKVLPFSIGAHPAFNWDKSSSAYFEFEEGLLSTYVISPDGILNEKVNIAAANGKLRIHEALFENDALIMDDIEKVTYWNNDRGVEMTFKGFPYVGLWSKPSGAPFVCIEPWHGIADFIDHKQDILSKKGIILLEENQFFTSEYEIKIL
jgi:galactose mutarotase-like enzyme